MKISRFSAFVVDQRGKSLHQKVLLVSLIAALMLATLPISSVIAAPRVQQDDQNNLEQEWASKLSQLAAEAAFFNGFQTKPGQFGTSGNQGQYLDKYRSALAAAQSLIATQGGFDSNGQVLNQNRASQAIRQLGQHLSTIRGLKAKIMEGSGNNNTSNAGFGGNDIVGIPVTGGASNDMAQGAAQNSQSSTPAQIWGGQFRELQAAQAWFNNFRTKPGRDRDSESISRYLDQYASALRQAYSIIANGGVVTTSQGGNDSGQSVNQSREDAQKQLAMYLSMMRGLRQKIAEGGRDNNNNNSAGNAQP